MCYRQADDCWLCYRRSDPLTLHVDDADQADLAVTHKLLVANLGPSFVPQTHLNVTVPFRDGAGLLLLQSNVTVSALSSGAGVAQWVQPQYRRRFYSLGAARDFSPRGSSQCGLSYSVRTAPVGNPHVATSERMRTIPNTGSHSIVRTRENTAHTDRNGYRFFVRCSCGCCSFTRVRRPKVTRVRRPKVPAGG